MSWREVGDALGAQMGLFGPQPWHVPRCEVELPDDVVLGTVESPLTGEAGLLRSVWPVTVEDCWECDRPVAAPTRVVEPTLAEIVTLRKEQDAPDEPFVWLVRECECCGDVRSPSAWRRG